MKKLLWMAGFLSMALISQAQPPAGDANSGDWYGEKITATGALPINEVAAKLNAGSVEGNAVNMKVQAKVVEVCPKKGCWMKLDLGNGETATVKMKDYGFFVPLAAKGKTVVIDGEISTKTISVAELKHYAEDAKKTQEEIDAIKEPQKEIRVLAKGIVVVD